ELHPSRCPRLDPVQFFHDRARGGGLRSLAVRAHPQPLRHQPQLRRRRARRGGARLPRHRCSLSKSRRASAMAYTPFKAPDVAGPKRDFIGYGRHVPKVRWPNGARVAISIVLNYEEGSEYSHANGDGRNDGLTEVIYEMDAKYRDLCAESVFEYGSRAGVWRLERLFTELNIPITFYASAVALERNREVGAWIKEAGHEPCGHGWRWEEGWLVSRGEGVELLRAPIGSIKETCGVRPVGWYCRYGPSVNTRELLVEEGGFVYDSDAYNDDLPYYVEAKGKRHLVIPYSMTYNDCKFGLLPSYGSPA